VIRPLNCQGRLLKEKFKREARMNPRHKEIPPVRLTRPGFFKRKRENQLIRKLNKIVRR
jgi:hypothetical protein